MPIVVSGSLLQLHKISLLKGQTKATKVSWILQFFPQVYGILPVFLKCCALSLYICIFFGSAVSGSQGVSEKRQGKQLLYKLEKKITLINTQSGSKVHFLRRQLLKF